MLRREAAVKAVIVDHWPMLRLGVSRVLQSIDIRVVGEAATGVEGLRRIRDEHVEIVLLGEHVEREVRDLVRQVKRLPEPPSVIVLVGPADADEVGALLTAGADSLLVRSVGPDELIDAVGRVLEGERVISPALMPLVIHAAAAVGAPASTPAIPDEAALTSKEREVLAWLAEGRSNQEIAEALYITPATVKTHLAHIYAKLGVKGRHEALARAVSLGYIR
jgi:DNA-binding NarL/FixJ family response regulator